MTKRINPASLPVTVGTMYPPPYDKPCRARERVRLGDTAGLSQFGVNRVTLAPGAWSSQRHFHTRSEEFVFVLSGELTLVTGEGEEVLVAGDAAGFRANDESGHCLQNRTEEPAAFLEMGTRIADDVAYYPGLDLVASPSGPSLYQHTDGTPYEDIRRRGPNDD